jgi:hypothetical protein
MTKIEEPGGTEVPDAEEQGTWVNQARDEPLPASHDDDHSQSAVLRNEEHAETHAGGRPGEPPAPQQSSPGVQPAQPAAQEPDETGPGKAVRDMMPGGPSPQGDVPDAPAVQVAATEGVHGGYVTAKGSTAAAAQDAAGQDARDEEHAGGQPGPVRLVSNAVPGKPDGEVDTRP